MFIKTIYISILLTSVVYRVNSQRPWDRNETGKGSIPRYKSIVRKPAFKANAPVLVDEDLLSLNTTNPQVNIPENYFHYLHFFMEKRNDETNLSKEDILKEEEVKDTFVNFSTPVFKNIENTRNVMDNPTNDNNFVNFTTSSSKSEVLKETRKDSPQTVSSTTITMLELPTTSKPRRKYARKQNKQRESLVNNINNNADTESTNYQKFQGNQEDKLRRSTLLPETIELEETKSDIDNEKEGQMRLENNNILLETQISGLLQNTEKSNNQGNLVSTPVRRRKIMRGQGKRKGFKPKVSKINSKVSKTSTIDVDEFTKTVRTTTNTPENLETEKQDSDYIIFKNNESENTEITYILNKMQEHTSDLSQKEQQNVNQETPTTYKPRRRKIVRKFKKQGKEFIPTSQIELEDTVVISSGVEIPAQSQTIKQTESSELNLKLQQTQPSMLITDSPKGIGWTQTTEKQVFYKEQQTQSIQTQPFNLEYLSQKTEQAQPSNSLQESQQQRYLTETRNGYGDSQVSASAEQSSQNVQLAQGKRKTQKSRVQKSGLPGNLERALSWDATISTQPIQKEFWTQNNLAKTSVPGEMQKSDITQKERQAQLRSPPQIKAKPSLSDQKRTQNLNQNVSQTHPRGRTKHIDQKIVTEQVQSTNITQTEQLTPSRGRTQQQRSTFATEQKQAVFDQNSEQSQPGDRIQQNRTSPPTIEPSQLQWKDQQTKTSWNAATPQTTQKTQTKFVYSFYNTEPGYSLHIEPQVTPRTQTTPVPSFYNTEPSYKLNIEQLSRNLAQSGRKSGERQSIIPILQSENHVFSHNGEFRYSYEGGDGTRAESRGILKSIDVNKTGEAVEGSFSYKDKDGNDFSLSYTADENGYRPVGAHLPTPPPIPPAIERALKYLATATTPESVTKAPKMRLI